jgi:hypothetical protein
MQQNSQATGDEDPATAQQQVFDDSVPEDISGRVTGGADDHDSEATEEKGEGDEDDEGDEGDEGGAADEREGTLAVVAADNADEEVVDMPQPALAAVENHADGIRNLFIAVQKLHVCCVCKVYLCVEWCTICGRFLIIHKSCNIPQKSCNTH